MECHSIRHNYPCLAEPLFMSAIVRQLDNVNPVHRKVFSQTVNERFGDDTTRSAMHTVPSCTRHVQEVCVTAGITRCTCIQTSQMLYEISKPNAHAVDK